MFKSLHFESTNEINHWLKFKNCTPPKMVPPHMVISTTDYMVPVLKGSILVFKSFFFCSFFRKNAWCTQVSRCVLIFVIVHFALKLDAYSHRTPSLLKNSASYTYVVSKSRRVRAKRIFINNSSTRRSRVLHNHGKFSNFSHF